MHFAVVRQHHQQAISFHSNWIQKLTVINHGRYREWNWTNLTVLTKNLTRVAEFLTLNLLNMKKFFKFQVTLQAEKDIAVCISSDWTLMILNSFNRIIDFWICQTTLCFKGSGLKNVTALFTLHLDTDGGVSKTKNVCWVWAFNLSTYTFFTIVIFPHNTNCFLEKAVQWYENALKHFQQ